MHRTLYVYVWSQTIWKSELLWLIAKPFVSEHQAKRATVLRVCAIMSHWLTLMPYAARIRERARSEMKIATHRGGIVSSAFVLLSRPISNYRALSLLITSGSAWLWQCDDGCCALILPHSAANTFACTDGSRLANSRTLTYRTPTTCGTRRHKYSNRRANPFRSFFYFSPDRQIIFLRVTGWEPVIPVWENRCRGKIELNHHFAAVLAGRQPEFIPGPHTGNSRKKG
jgi:hypothetical protein